jgi:hypothetical protein
MSSVIDTASALAKMNDTWDERTSSPKTYGLRFGSQKGFREIYNARKGVRHPQQKREERKTTGNHANLKLSGLVQVFDDDIQQFRDIKFAQIIAFRDHNSSTWQPIKLI